MTPTYDRNRIPAHLRPLVRRLVHQEGETLAALHVGTDVVVAWGLGWQADRLPIVIEETDRIRAQAVADLAGAVRRIARVSHLGDSRGHLRNCPGCALDQVLATIPATAPITTTAYATDPGE